MDILVDYSFWIYLLLMIVLFARKRKKGTDMKQNQKGNDDDQPLGRKVSWEDLMRELKRQTEADTINAPKDDVLTEVFPVHEIVTVDSTAVENNGNLTCEESANVVLQESIEENKNTVLKNNRKTEPVKQECTSDSNTDWSFNSLDDAKRAFVYSEILRPKF